MYKKCSFFYEWWYLFANWWSSPLGPVLAQIFMVELERSLVPKLSNYIKFWKRFVDGTISSANTEATDHILMVLDSSDPAIQFTYETEENSKLPFSDVMLYRKKKQLFVLFTESQLIMIFSWIGTPLLQNYGKRER